MVSDVKMSIAVLDDYLNNAGSAFKSLSSRIEVVEFRETLQATDSGDRDRLIQRLKPFTVLSTMRERTKLPAEVLKSLPNLKLILTTGLKNASIDMNACKELHISVAGASGKGRSDITPAPGPAPNSLDSTMQHTWALILGLCRNIARDDATVKAGGWQSVSAVGLKGKTLGLLGLGKLGAMTANVAVHGFGMKVAAWSQNITQEKADEQAKAFGLSSGTFEAVGSKEELLRKADVLSIHYVLSERSKNIIDANELSMMKSNAIIVNTSRGPLINEDALLNVLQNGKIRGVALDVYDLEPLPTDSPWRSTKWGVDGRSEVLLSPHMGYAEEDVMKRWYEECAENLERFLDGKELMHRLA
jgi:lactate dehydrogenase-like 2-hydroxyacid dehydrogenase